MPGKSIAIPEGRVVTAPETPHGGRSSDAAGPVPVRVTGPSVEVTAVVERVPAAYAVISGDKHDEVTVGWAGGTWTLEWPEDAGVTSYGGAHVSFGRVQVNSFGGGEVYINGVRVDGMGGGATKEQPRVHLVLPPGCSLHADLQSGGVYAPATADPRHGLALASVSSQSGGFQADCAVGQIAFSSQSGGLTANGLTGPVQSSTMSGGVTLAHAAGDVMAKTMSGSVRVHCEESISVVASSMSGDVRVTAAAGSVPTGSGSSMSGSTSLPPSMSGKGRRNRW